MSSKKDDDIGQYSGVKKCTACNKTNEKYGNLLECVSCTISFHATCAGYAKTDTLPHPWKCWQCAGGAEHWQHPTEPLHISSKKDRESTSNKTWTIFIASDKYCEIFYKAVVLKHTNDSVTVKYPQWPDYPPEKFSLSDQRLWRGNLLKSAWHYNEKDKSLQPKSRVLTFIGVEAEKEDQNTDPVEEAVNEKNEISKEQLEEAVATAAAMAAAAQAADDEDAAAAAAATAGVAPSTSSPTSNSPNANEEEPSRKKKRKENKEKRKREDLEPKHTDGEKNKKKTTPAAPPLATAAADNDEKEDKSPVDEAMEDVDGDFIEEIELGDGGFGDHDDDLDKNGAGGGGNVDGGDSGGNPSPAPTVSVKDADEHNEDGSEGNGGGDVSDGAGDGARQEENKQEEENDDTSNNSKEPLPASKRLRVDNAGPTSPLSLPHNAEIRYLNLNTGAVVTSSSERRHRHRHPQPQDHNQHQQHVSEDPVVSPSAEGTATPPPTQSLQVDDKECESALVSGLGSGSGGGGGGSGSGNGSGGDSPGNAAIIAAGVRAAAKANAFQEQRLKEKVQQQDVVAKLVPPAEKKTDAPGGATHAGVNNIETIDLTKQVDESPAVRIITVGDQDILIPKPPPPSSSSPHLQWGTTATLTGLVQDGGAIDALIGGAGSGGGVVDNGLPVLPRRKSTELPAAITTAVAAAPAAPPASLPSPSPVVTQHSPLKAIAQSAAVAIAQEYKLQQLKERHIKEQQLKEQQKLRYQQQQYYQQQQQQQQQQYAFKPPLILSRPALDPEPTTTTTTKPIGPTPALSDDTPVYIHPQIKELTVTCGGHKLKTTGLFLYDLRSESWCCAAYGHPNERNEYPVNKDTSSGTGGAGRNLKGVVVLNPKFKFASPQNLDTSITTATNGGGGNKQPNSNYWKSLEDFTNWYQTQVATESQVAALNLKWKTLEELSKLGGAEPTKLGGGVHVGNKGKGGDRGGGVAIPAPSPPKPQPPQKGKQPPKQQQQEQEEEKDPKVLKEAFVQLLGDASAASARTASKTAPSPARTADIDAANVLANLAESRHRPPSAGGASSSPSGRNVIHHHHHPTTTFFSGRAPSRSKKQSIIASPNPLGGGDGTAIVLPDYGLRPTSESISLGIGSEIEVRWFDPACGIRGSWYAAKIIDMMPAPAPAPHFRFYRIECTELYASGSIDDPVREWMPLATIAPWDKEELVVHIRTLPKTRAYHPTKPPSPTTAGTTTTAKIANNAGKSHGQNTPNTTTTQPDFPKFKKGQRVEAFWHAGWWMGWVRNFKSKGKEIEVDFDDAPLGEGGDPIVLPRYQVRPQHPNENQWFGMLTPGKYDYYYSTNRNNSQSGGVVGQNNNNNGVGAGASPPANAAAVVTVPTMAATNANNAIIMQRQVVPKEVVEYITTLPVEKFAQEHQNVEQFRQDLLARVQQLKEQEAYINVHQQRVNEAQAKMTAKEERIYQLARHLGTVELELLTEHEKRKAAIEKSGPGSSGSGPYKNNFEKFVAEQKAAELDRKEKELLKKAEQLDQLKQHLEAKEKRVKADYDNKVKAMQAGYAAANRQVVAAATAATTAAIQANFHARAMPSLPHLQGPHQAPLVAILPPGTAVSTAVPLVYSRPVMLPASPPSVMLPPQQQAVMLHQPQQLQQQYQPMQFVPITNEGVGNPAADITTNSTASDGKKDGKQQQQQH